MRKHMIGAVQECVSWSPQFRTIKPRRRATNREGRENTPVMSYFPAIKGEPRMERLRHYFHIDMALLLDARPRVVGWEAEAPAIDVTGGATPFSYRPDFRVQERDEVYCVRLLRSGTNMTPAQAERHDLVREAYRERDEGFRVITQEELTADSALPAARLLFRERVRDWPEDLPELVVAACGAGCPTTLGVIHAQLGGGREAWHWLLSLAAHGFVEIELDGNILPATVVLSCTTRGYRR
jgi:hypothetical protein